MAAAARIGPSTRLNSRKQYSLHVFQKKSKHGIETPKPDLDIIRERLKLAEQMVKEMRNA